jgi:hypothetical protein
MTNFQFVSPVHFSNPLFLSLDLNTFSPRLLFIKYNMYITLRRAWLLDFVQSILVQEVQKVT